MIMKSVLKFLGLTLCAAILSGMASAAAVGADSGKNSGNEQRLSKKDIPQAVAAAFEKAYPEAEIKEASRESRDSTTVYEIVSLDGSVERTITYTADGRVAEIEEVIGVQDLPETAQQLLTKEYPKGKVAKAEKVAVGSKTTFEVLIVSGENRVKIVFDSTGKLINTEKKAEEEKDED
jgi:hypothetical protein